MPRYIVALTGASGVVYGIALARELLAREYEVHLVASEPARIVIEQELKWSPVANWEDEFSTRLPGPLVYHDNADIAAPIASGSFITSGMIVVPCTMSTLAAVANGMSNNLIERAADVMIKEKRPLIMVPRETPLSVIHLTNMLKLAQIGVQIVPAMPGYYYEPQTMTDMVNFVVGKVMDSMGITHNLYKRYE
ncbi:MAG TPA: aromatic acid decarboxylase [Syntrophomonas sp.]|jgi:4-hydroxy-3-polyprenylbenzoate decarboxylase|nr:aromatic acid decarboxylase [Syntrophomonas sp.]